MIKKVMIIAMLLLAFCINGKSQIKDVYNETIDSLLVSMSHLIKDDLSKNSIKVLERSWIGFGESFILEVVFDSKTTSMLTANRISEVMSEKFQKQKRSLKRNYKSSAFMHYINEYHALPYFFLSILILVFCSLQKTRIIWICAIWRISIQSYREWINNQRKTNRDSPR